MLRRKTRCILFCSLLLICIISGITLLQHQADMQHNQEITETAANLAGAPTPNKQNPVQHPAAPDTQQEPVSPDITLMLDTDITILQERNPDVIGWLYVPGTEISYPILHGNTNQQYLRTGWDGEYNIAGSIFLDAKNQPDLSDYNTIIYGHNMKNGSMFAGLHSFMTNTLPETDTAYIRLNDIIYEYRLIAAYETPKTSDTYLINPEDQTGFLNTCIKQSVFPSPEINNTALNLLTLSTCSSNPTTTRIVVQYTLIATHPVMITS